MYNDNFFINKFIDQFRNISYKNIYRILYEILHVDFIIIIHQSKNFYTAYYEHGVMFFNDEPNILFMKRVYCITHMIEFPDFNLYYKGDKQAISVENLLKIEIYLFKYFTQEEEKKITKQINAITDIMRKNVNKNLELLLSNAKELNIKSINDNYTADKSNDTIDKWNDIVISNIMENSLKIANSIYDVHDLLKLETANIKLDCHYFNFILFLNDIFYNIENLCIEKKINFSYVIMSIPENVFSDICRLKQILINIFDITVEFAVDTVDIIIETLYIHPTEIIINEYADYSSLRNLGYYSLDIIINNAGNLINDGNYDMYCSPSVLGSNKHFILHSVRLLAKLFNGYFKILLSSANKYYYKINLILDA